MNDLKRWEVMFEADLHSNREPARANREESHYLSVEEARRLAEEDAAKQGSA